MGRCGVWWGDFFNWEFFPPSKVMLAATFWSLLEPAIEMADLSGVYGAFAFVPVVVGFVAGAAFVYLADVILPHMVRTTVSWLLTIMS